MLWCKAQLCQETRLQDAILRQKRDPKVRSECMLASHQTPFLRSSVIKLCLIATAGRDITFAGAVIYVRGWPGRSCSSTQVDVYSLQSQLRYKVCVICDVMCM